MRRIFNRSKIIAGAVSICLVAGLLSACADKKTQEEEVEKKPVPEIKIEVTPVEEEEPDGPVSLLTNEITEEDLSSTRPIAVMIENTKVALPHYGLADAGVIYEVPVEGGITRYMAFYDDYTSFEKLGNVRSTRPYFIYIASEFGAILAHYGQSNEARGILNSGIVAEIDGMQGGKAYFRSSDKKAPHNAYLESEGMLADIAGHGISMERSEDAGDFFTFAEEENLLPSGRPATTIKLYYQNNHPWFEYDSSTGTYKRYAYGTLEPDALSEEGIEVTNIIFQDIPCSVADSEGHLSIKLTGSGTGMFFTRGKAVDITWTKDSDKGRTRYYMPDGSEIELNTGKTFVCLTENSQKDRNVIESASGSEDDGE